MKKQSISKFFEKRSVRAALVFSLVAGISGTITYFAFPNIIKGDAGGNDIIIDDGGDSYQESSVDKFASKLTETTGIDGNLNFSVSFPDKDDDPTTMNVISVKDAELKLSIPSTKNIGFDFRGNINYNDWNSESLEKASTHINFVDGNAYIDFWGGKVAYLDTEYRDLIGEFISIFSDSIVKVPDELYDFLEKILGSDDSGATDEPSEEGTTSSKEEGGSSLADTSMNWTLVDDGAQSKQYKLDLGISNMTITLNLWSDADYNLTRVLAENLTFGDATMNLDFKTNINDNELESIRAMTPADAKNYTSLYQLNGIIRKVGTAIAKERFGLDVDLNINHTEEKVDENIGINLDGNLDFGEKNFMAGLELVNEGDKTYSQKLNLAYIDAKSKEDATAYLNYNDVAKASMNLLTMEALLSRMQKDGNNENSQDLSYLAKIFDFVFDSEIVKAVQKGRYEIVADEIEKINVSANKIVLGLKLDKLGFGSSSRIDIVFDGKKDAPISEITLSGIKAKNFALDGTIKVNTYFYQEMDTQGYYHMDHLPDVFDQVSDLVSSKQATLGLEGSVLDENQYGVRLNGETSFDANLKNGTGSVVLSQINSNYTKNHLFALDIDEKQAFFNYNDNDKKEEYPGLNGSITLSSVSDLIDFIKGLTGEASFKNRFGGIFSSLQQDATTGIVNDVLAGKYAALLSAKILKSCHISSSQVELVINGELFALESDLDIVVAFADTNRAQTNENGETTDEIVRNIKSVCLKDFVVSGQKINLTLTLKKYNNVLSTLDKNATYTDFSGVTDLAEYMLNTATKLDTYHLKSSVSVILWTADIITIDADLYISIQEDGTKIYGTLSNIPLIPAVNNDTWLFGHHGDDASFYRSVDFYYDGKNIYAHGVNPFGVFEAEDENGVKQSYDLTEIQDYKYDTSYFKKTDNIIHFLLKDVINMQDRLLKKVNTNGISLPESKSALATEKLFKSFSFDKENIAWNVKLDLGGLLGNDFLKDLELNVTGTKDKYIKGMDMALTIFAGVKIQLLADVSLESIGQNSFPTDAFNSYISAHQKDAVSAK